MLGHLPVWAQAGLWGLLGASSLVLGATTAFLIDLPKRVTAGIMAFGCGVLISAVAYDLIMEGFDQGGIWPIIAGALGGALAYTAANLLVIRQGGKHRKRSGDHLKSNATDTGGIAIAAGSLLDGIPESIVLGVSLIGGANVSLPMLAAIMLSNFPEGLSSATGMRKAGHSKWFVLGLWSSIAVLSALAALMGAALLGSATDTLLAAVNAVAAGALLAMITDTMIPEAVEDEQGGTGLLVVAGLLVAFALSRMQA